MAGESNYNRNVRKDYRLMIDYEKKYNEALSTAKKLYNEARSNEYTSDMEDYERIFPELRESEDERIRKRLVSYIRACPLHDEPKKEFLAWLEKKKEPRDPFDDEQFKRGYEAGKHDAEREQKPKVPKPHKGDDTNPYDMSVSEAQEYAINRGFGIPFNDGEVFVDERHITQTIGNILRWADEHPKEQKPASGNSEKPNNLLREQPEVELEKEFEDYLGNMEGQPRMWHSDEQIEWAKDIARHFAEWGAIHFNTRKEE